IPDPREFHFWNTNAFLQCIPNDGTGRMIVISIAVALFTSVCYMLRNVRGSIGFFVINALLTLAVAFVFPLTTARYVGFIFIAFIIASWLHLNERPMRRGSLMFMGLILVTQMVGSVIAVGRDHSLPFSNAARVRDLAARVPANAMIVTDYWSLSTLSAFLDRPFYSLEHRKELSFLRWDQDLVHATQQPDFYSSGLRDLWEQRGLSEVYLISVNDSESIRSRDSELSTEFDVALIDKCEGAIEAHSNVYLYRIGARPE
ncbi:MAG TPA: hypothetical protein PK760_11840, partial [Flavobacteriales bacterium]|nr:hypothetical protein [Flavobacteriales bacterium]